MLNTLLHGAGYPLVWGHGLMGSMALEDATGWFHPDSSDAVRRVRYDARGHGGSPASPNDAAYLWPTLGQDMLEIARRHAGQQRFALGGQSMGCASALYAALAAAEQTSHLVLALPPTAWESRPAQVERYRKMTELISRHGMGGLIQASRRYPSLPAWLREARPTDSQAMLDALSTLDEARLLPILEGAARSDLPAPEQLQCLQMPALILAWPGDSIHPLDSAHRLAEYLPQGQLEIAQSVEQVQRWPQLIDRFLSDFNHPKGALNGSASIKRLGDK